jgi:hypothetical protein
MLSVRSKSVFFVIVASTVLLVAPAFAAQAISTSAADQTKATKSYVFKLSIGMPEQMWTRAQVRAKHPKTGEVMVGGAMAGGMAMGGSTRHLEVHVTSRATGKVVMGAHPTISAIDANVKNAMMMKVPVAMMQGVSEGVADLHYGNNVNLVAGHIYKVAITLRGERVVFRIKSPKR